MKAVPHAGEVIAYELSGLLGAAAFRSVLWLSAGKWINRISALLVFAVLSRFLTPSQLGVAALAATFVAFFAVLSDQGFGASLIQRSTLQRGHSDAAFGFSLATALVLFAVVAVLAYPISHLFGAALLAPVLILTALSLPLDAMCSVPAALLSRSFGYKQLAQRQMLANVISGAAAVTVASFGGGVWSLVVQSMGASIVNLVVLYRIIDWRPTWRIERQYLSQLRKVGTSVLGIQLLGAVNNHSDKLLIGLFFNPASVAYYYVGSRIIAVVIDLQTAVFQQISLSTFSRLQHDLFGLRKMFLRFVGSSSAVSAFSFAALAALAPMLVPAVFGAHYGPSVLICQVLCAYGAINSVLVFERSLFVASNNARLALVLASWQAAIGVIAVLVTVRFGPIGVAIGVTLRQYLVWPMRVRWLAELLDIRARDYLWRWGGPALAGLSTGAVMWLAVYSIPADWPGLVRLGCGASIALLGLVVYSAIGHGLFLDSMRSITTTVRHRVRVDAPSESAA